MTLSRFIAAALVALSLAACATAPPRTEVPSLFVPWGALRQDSSQTVFFNDRDLPPGVVVADHTGDGEIVVLALSGGGSYGAFGAGVLAGWSQTGTRPEADVVTGVSAGALLATYAFLGPDYDKPAEEIYASITNQKVYERRDLLAIPFSASIANQTPLRKLMEEIITDTVIDSVAKERRERGRRLLVASTDLDNGRVVVWDLSSIATSTRPDRNKIYIDALMASSAIPVFFEPVMISPEPDSPEQRLQLHVDGSLSTSVFIPSLEDASLKVPLKVYAIINSQMMESRSEKPLSVNTMDISTSAVMKMMRTVLQRSVYDSFLATVIAGGEFYILGIPEDVIMTSPQYKFTPEVSTALYNLGFTMSRQNKWENDLPRFDSLTTQIRRSSLMSRLRGAPSASSRVGK